jgi:hypothetical protein
MVELVQYCWALELVGCTVVQSAVLLTYALVCSTCVLYDIACSASLLIQILPRHPYSTPMIPTLHSQALLSSTSFPFLFYALLFLNT